MPTAQQIKRLKKAQDYLEEVWIQAAGSDWTTEDARNLKDARRALYAVEMRWDDIGATEED